METMDLSVPLSSQLGQCHRRHLRSQTVTSTRTSSTIHYLEIPASLNHSSAKHMHVSIGVCFPTMDDVAEIVFMYTLHLHACSMESSTECKIIAGH